MTAQNRAVLYQLLDVWGPQVVLETMADGCDQDTRPGDARTKREVAKAFRYMAERLPVSGRPSASEPDPGNEDRTN